MKHDSHIPDEDLTRALDGELTGARSAEAQTHLSRCEECRSRRDELELAMAAFMRMKDHPAIPPADGPAARLRAEMAQPLPHGRGSVWAPAYVGMAAVAVAAVIWLSGKHASAAGPLPNARLTPGATRLISRDQVCVVPPQDDDRTVPVELAHRVFLEYRIAKPEPGAYEVDFLISPTLGGADDIRNLWPQPYTGGVWNSRVKDALEDHLRRMVCEGRVDLATAQQEISTDWIAAYRKYFRTERPLAAHALFVKDRPWQ
jgi:hypothetical protein